MQESSDSSRPSMSQGTERPLSNPNRVTSLPRRFLDLLSQHTRQGEPVMPHTIEEQAEIDVLSHADPGTLVNAIKSLETQADKERYINTASREMATGILDAHGIREGKGDYSGLLDKQIELCRDFLREISQPPRGEIKE